MMEPKKTYTLKEKGEILKKVEALGPLNLRQVSDALGMSISTLSQLLKQRNHIKKVSRTFQLAKKENSSRNASPLRNLNKNKPTSEESKVRSKDNKSKISKENRVPCKSSSRRSCGAKGEERNMTFVVGKNRRLSMGDGSSASSGSGGVTNSFQDVRPIMENVSDEGELVENNSKPSKYSDDENTCKCDGRLPSKEKTYVVLQTMNNKMNTKRSINKANTLARRNFPVININSAMNEKNKRFSLDNKRASKNEVHQVRNSLGNELYLEKSIQKYVKKSNLDVKNFANNSKGKNLSNNSNSKIGEIDLKYGNRSQKKNICKTVVTAQKREKPSRVKSPPFCKISYNHMASCWPKMLSSPMTSPNPRASSRPITPISHKVRSSPITNCRRKVFVSHKKIKSPLTGGTVEPSSPMIPSSQKTPQCPVTLSNPKVRTKFSSKSHSKSSMPSNTRYNSKESFSTVNAKISSSSITSNSKVSSPIISNSKVSLSSVTSHSKGFSNPRVSNSKVSRSITSNSKVPATQLNTNSKVSSSSEPLNSKLSPSPMTSNVKVSNAMTYNSKVSSSPMTPMSVVYSNQMSFNCNVLSSPLNSSNPTLPPHIKPSPKPITSSPLKVPNNSKFSEDSTSKSCKKALFIPEETLRCKSPSHCKNQSKFNLSCSAEDLADDKVLFSFANDAESTCKKSTSMLDASRFKNPPKLKLSYNAKALGDDKVLSFTKDVESTKDSVSPTFSIKSELKEFTQPKANCSVAASMQNSDPSASTTLENPSNPKLLELLGIFRQVKENGKRAPLWYSFAVDRLLSKECTISYKTKVPEEHSVENGECTRQELLEALWTLQKVLKSQDGPPLWLSYAIASLFRDAL